MFFPALQAWITRGRRVLSWPRWAEKEPLRGVQQAMVSLFNELSRCGFQILAFPCNQFGAQEPGTNAEIAQFAKKQVVMLETNDWLLVAVVYTSSAHNIPPFYARNIPPC